MYWNDNNNDNNDNDNDNNDNNDDGYNHCYDIENQANIIQANIIQANITQANGLESGSIINEQKEIELNQLCLSNKFVKSKSYPSDMIVSTKHNYKTNLNIKSNTKLQEQIGLACKNNPMNLNLNLDLDLDSDSDSEFKCYKKSNINTNLIKNKSTYNYFIGSIYKKLNFTSFNRIKIIDLINKLLTICLHVFIMIVFEIFFYFNYVVKIEKNEFMQKITTYIGQMKNLNEYLGSEQFKLIKYLYKNNLSNDNDLLSKLFIQYIKSEQLQKQILHTLLIKACKMAGIVGLVWLGLLGIGLWIGGWKKIQFKWIGLENLLMFLFLGIFEYFFFTTIVMGFSPVTDAEIKYIGFREIVKYFNSTV